MINRVLIRIKVVQMLYCYLLTQNDFRIESLPDSPSKDKKYAHTFYIDLLLMILHISGFRFQGDFISVAGIGNNRYLASNRVFKALQSDAEVRKIAYEKARHLSEYSDAIVSIYDGIIKSSAYKSYIRHKNTEIADDVEFWRAIIGTVMAKNPSLMSVARKNPEFTLVGYESAFELLSESIKKIGDTKSGYIEAIKSLRRSLDKAYELYHALLLLPVEITRIQDMRLDSARNKFLPTMEDLNPNTRFVDNRLVKILSENSDLENYVKTNPISWNDNPMLLRTLLDKILASDFYARYMESETDSLRNDCDFWRTVFRNVILPSDELTEALEQNSVYWNDDIDIISTFVLKTFKRLANEETDGHLLPQFKDEIDARFGNELFEYTVKHFEEYRSYIDKFVDSRQWDPERLAFMDVVIMATAISELMNYSEIPIPVTLNEYIEIANCYSTPNSGQFINGILYSVINYLKNEGKLVKN